MYGVPSIGPIYQSIASAEKRARVETAEEPMDLDVIERPEVKVEAIHPTCMYSSPALCKDPRFVTTCDLVQCTKHNTQLARNNLEVDDPGSYYLRPFPVKTRGGYFHFKRLGLFAHLTRRGFIVVGKLWHDIYAETLTGCDVQRDADYGSHINPRKLTFDNNRMATQDLIGLCQSNGLLYKVVPQEYLQYPYDITNLEELPGEGFTSFEQLSREAPDLYVHYWKVWNQHISRVKKWLMKRGQTPLAIYRETGVRAWINWEEVNATASLYGANHVIIPPPPLHQVRAPGFDPFAYCRQWVQQHCPQQLSAPHFPPMYLIYPPAPSEAWKTTFAVDLKDIVKVNRSLVESYHYFMDNPLAMMQWIKFGNPNLFTLSRSDVPPRLHERLGASQWADLL